MRYVKNNILSIITLILLICVAFTGFFCYKNLLSNQNSSQSSQRGEAINNTIEITNTGTDLSFAASKGLRSAVSIYCSFTATAGGSMAVESLSLSANVLQRRLRCNL